MYYDIRQLIIYLKSVSTNIYSTFLLHNYNSRTLFNVQISLRYTFVIWTQNNNDD